MKAMLLAAGYGSRLVKSLTKIKCRSPLEDNQYWDIGSKLDQLESENSI